MTSTQITKIRGAGIHTTSNIVSHNINSSGIITAVAFKGPFTGSSNIQSGILTATKIDFNGDIDVDGHTNLDNVNVAGVATFTGDATFSGNVSIGGTLTYEDVTNIDSVGIITARDGLKVLAGGANVVGVITATTFKGDGDFVDIDVDGQTDLDVLNVSDTATFSGNSVVSGNYFDIQDTKKLRLGTDGDLSLYHQGGANFIKNSSSQIIHIQTDASIRFNSTTGSENILIAEANGPVKLFYNNSNKIETTNTGAVVTGILTATSFSGGLPITNGADNRVITASSASAIQGESSLTFDGTQLEVNGSSTNYPIKVSGTANAKILLTGSVSPYIQLQEGTTNRAYVYWDSNNNRFELKNEQENTYVRLDSQINFSIGNQEKLRITSEGQGILTGTNSGNHMTTFGSNVGGLTIDDVGGQHTGLEVSHGSNKVFLVASSNNSVYFSSYGTGNLIFEHTGGGGTRERFVINSSGTIQCKGETDVLNNILRVTDATPRIIMSVPSGGLDTRLFNDGSGNFIIGHGTNSDAPPERLKITSAGKTVFSEEIETPQDYPNQRPTLDLNFAAVKKLDSRITYYRTGPASYVDEYGLVQCVGANTPRFDHDPLTGESKGLLIEASRTNMFAGTANMSASGGVWQTGGSRGAQGANVKGPDGKMTAYQNVYNGTSGDLNIYYSPRNGASEMTTTNDTTYTMSVWAKLSAGASYITGCRLRTYGQNISVNYNLATGVVLGDGSNANNAYENQGSDFVSSSIEEYPDGWYRCIMTFKSGTDGNQGFQIYMISGVNNHALNSSGANGESVSFWGAQLEVGSYATSFIPTDLGNDPNAWGPTTRGSDFAFIDGTSGTDFDDIYRLDEGTFVVDWFNNPKGNHNDGYVLTVDDGTGNNRIGAVNSNNYQVTVTSGGSSQGTRDLGSINSGDNKIAFTYKLNDQATSLNGSDASVDTSCTLPTGLKYIWFGLRQGAYDLLGGYISRIIYYPKRLPNNQLKNLSS